MEPDCYHQTLHVRVGPQAPEQLRNFENTLRHVGLTFDTIKHGLNGTQEEFQHLKSEKLIF